MVRGLYIGKFAPLHKGHEQILNTALMECDEVTVFIYNSVAFDRQHPALDKILRAYWVKNAYPEVDVRVGYEPPPDDYTLEGDRLHAEYVRRHLREDARDGSVTDALYGGEPWVKTMSEALRCEPRMLNRDGRGISATKVRDDPMQYAWYLRPEIRDYMLVHYGTTKGLHI